jgi:murein DD-endopeptidase MepM/ murein hydrolase activator NlpD
MRHWLAAALLVVAVVLSPAGRADDAMRIVFPESVSQGAMVIGKVPPGSQVEHAGRKLRVTGYGSVVFGVGRDATGPAAVTVRRPDGSVEDVRIAVTPRDWPVERVTGVPPRTVSPPPEVAERIRREAAQVGAARAADDARADFAQAFIWPVTGRISGRFGNQRIYNGTPGSAHSGMDIAAPTGTPVKAPAAGIVTLAAPDFYITGGTLLIDHGHGISSNFLHLSRINVKVGDRVEQGQVVAAVGATGRATGPHLHWGMNWFDVRIDPLLVLERAEVARRSAVVELTGPTLVGYLVGEAKDEGGLLASALSSTRGCLLAGGMDARSEMVRGERLVLSEDGAEIELVLPEARGAYLFWPGRKPGEHVSAKHPALATAMKAAAAGYFENPACAAG